MAQQGDRYVVELKEPHLQWGEYRYTDTRETVKDEGYIPIPLNDARRLELVNSNATGGKDILEKNLFRYTTCDGYCKGFLKAQGSSVGGSQYAKQFSQQGDLRAIGLWYKYIGAHVGTKIEVFWSTPKDIVLSYR